jgi:hypothetical protein
LLLEIWDCNPQPPPLEGAEVESLLSLDLEGGRGLFLVGQYSEQWNYYPTAQWGGKVVWAIFS